MKQSIKQIEYIKHIKRKKFFVLITQVLISILFLIIWEILSKYKVINPFIFSSPSKIIRTIINLFKNNNLMYHIWVTSYETLIAFLITTFLSFSNSCCGISGFKSMSECISSAKSKYSDGIFI